MTQGSPEPIFLVTHGPLDEIKFIFSEGEDEDRNINDLFASNIEENISENVTRSLKGLEKPLNNCDRFEEESESANEQTDEEDLEEGSIEDDFEDVLTGEEGLNEDSEEEGSFIDSDEEGEDGYPVFNPDVDFKVRIMLKLGLEFPSVDVLRDVVRTHAIKKTGMITTVPSA